MLGSGPTLGSAVAVARRRESILTQIAWDVAACRSEERRHPLLRASFDELVDVIATAPISISPPLAGSAEAWEAPGGGTVPVGATL